MRTKSEKLFNMPVPVPLDAITEMMLRGIHAAMTDAVRDDYSLLQQLPELDLSEGAKSMLLEQLLNGLQRDIQETMARKATGLFMALPHFVRAVPRLMKAKNIDTKTLSETSGLSEWFIHGVTVNTAQPDQRGIHALARALDCDPIWLLTGMGKPDFKLD